MGLSRPPNTGPPVFPRSQGPKVPGFLDRVPPKYEGQFHYAASAEFGNLPYLHLATSPASVKREYKPSIFP
jgi:hypothetical protein